MNAYDALPCAVLVTDADGSVQQMNADLLALLGGSIADWQGQRLDALLPPASQIFMHTHLWPMLLRDGKLVEVYLQIQDRAGERIPVLINCRQEALTFVWVLFVSKERSRFESELVLARQQAETASAAKSSFLANMSHEIRTPMNAVLGLLQVLQHAGLDERGRGHANRAEQAARALLRVLDDVLDLSDVESGRLTLASEDFELQAFLAELVLMLGSGDGAATVELLIEVASDVPARLFGDRHRLQQVLLNLCANALKFTHQGQVAVAISCSGTRVMFSVQDTGIGIAADQLTMIFEAFTQVDASASRRFGGSGLGLAICKRLVALMGGELAVESVSGEGSRFFFDLSLRDAHHLPALASVAPVSLVPLSCLIADPHPDARRILRDLLLARGDQVAEVTSTPALLMACERQRYDVVLVDQRLLDGHERALGQLHARWAVAPQTVVCARHVAVQQANGVAALGLQVAATLDKPVLACHLHNAFAALAGATSAAVAAAPAGVRQQLAGLRVLVVDDNSLNQEVARDLLSAVGASVDVAGDGYTALSMLADRVAFDVVLMDIQMPGIDGYDTTRAIRRQARWRHMPIIAVTANVLPSDRMAALTAGMNDHVGKPLDLALLVGVIRHHLFHEKRPVDATGSDAAGTDDSWLDVEAAIVRLGGSRPLYRRLLESFMVGNIDFLPTLRAALDTHDVALALRLLHTLKGNAATIGAWTLSRNAGLVEQAVRRNEAVNGSEALADILKATIAHIGTLTTQLKDGEEAGAALATPDGPLLPEVLALVDLLKASNMEALASFEQLHERLKQQLPLLAPTLHTAMLAFNFEQAHTVCQQIAAQLGNG